MHSCHYLFLKKGQVGAGIFDLDVFNAFAELWPMVQDQLFRVSLVSTLILITRNVKEVSFGT